MRKLMISILVASAAVTAVPASAQGWRLQPNVHRQIQQDINQLERRIENSQRRGAISPREANGLRRQALDTQRLYQRFARNGLDRREVQQLEQRVNVLHARLRMERRDWDGRRG